MADVNYEIRDDVAYNPEVRALKDTDRASATHTLNPLFQKMINNNHAVKKKTEDLEENANIVAAKVEALSEHVQSVEYIARNQNKGCTITVGSALAGYIAGQVDFLVMGINDQIQINQAINSLPEGGGRVLLMEGTYHLSESIRINKANTALQGQGPSTIISKEFTGYALYFMMPDCEAADMLIEGNRDPESVINSNAATYTTSNSAGTVLRNLIVRNQGGSGILCGIEDISIYNCVSMDNGAVGISFNAASTATRSRAIVYNCKCIDNTTSGIYMSGNIINSVISGNILTGNSYGIYCTTGNNVVLANNVCNGNTADGIFVTSGKRVNITGNICTANGRGIRLSSSAEECMVTGNLCLDNETVQIADGGNSNVVINNQIGD